MLPNNNNNIDVFKNQPIPNGEFHIVPDNLQYVIKDIFEIVVFKYLLQFNNRKDNSAFPSYESMTQGVMSRPKAIDAVKGLITKGYISKENRYQTSNIYTIHFDKLVNDIHQSTEFTSKRGLLGRDRKHKQKLPIERELGGAMKAVQLVKQGRLEDASKINYQATKQAKLELGIVEVRKKNKNLKKKMIEKEGEKWHTNT